MLLRSGLLLGVLLLVGGCATPRHGGEAFGAASATDAAAASPVTRALYAQHSSWKGVPYRLGGTSKRGVDCSGFVAVTFRSHFDLELPRTTGGQLGVGRAVAPEALQPGDLVFFRTGRGKNGRHVGIYLEGGRFLHASTSQGVTISRLDNPYWARNYWKARRPDLPQR